MKGDFTRGHRPDGKRAQRYTRGLLQQRRLLLDSDVNSMTDALHERLRDLASDLGCPKGSPDLGFLVTPGRLLAVFEELDRVVVNENNVTVYRDYSRKFLDRFPSVFIAADQGVAGSATLRVLRPADGDVRFWARSEFGVQVDLPGGVPLNVPAGDPFVPVDVNLAGPLDEIQIDLAAGEQVWIGLIEQLQPAGVVPRLAVNEGRFYLDGLPLALDEGGLYSDVAFPLDPGDLLVGPPPPPLAVNDRVVAFLEGWERHVTAVEDAGLLERALGGNLDTTTRGQAVGQVKLVRVPAGPLDTAVLSHAVCEPAAASGTLEVTTPAAPPDPDPCALPVDSGYTGPDNRLYRFEVHSGGPLGQAVLKWSRDNGSELLAAIDAPNDSRLIFPSNTPLRAGDLVEALNEAVDLGDRGPAQLPAPDQFQRPERAAGPFALLEQAAGPAPANGAAFVLRQVSGVGDVNLDPNIFGPFPGGEPIKVRRWHGRIETVAGTTEYELEHGIVIELNGEFSAGDYWQHEARIDGDNDNGPPALTPHGPLRAFAPLALLRFDGAAQPLELVEWLDDRFNPICELNADDLPFDGERVGEEDCDTVQEAIECLFEQGVQIIEASCGELIAQSVNGLQNVFDTIPDGGDARICIQPAVRNLPATVIVENKGHLIVSGTGEGVRLVRDGVVLRFSGCRRVELRDFQIEGSVEFVNCEEVAVQGLHVIHPGGGAAVRIVSPGSGPTPGAQVSLRHNRVRTGLEGDGVFVLNAQQVDIENNDIAVDTTPFEVSDLLFQEGGPAAIANVLMDLVFIDFPPGLDSNIFVGSPVVRVGTGPWGRPQIVSGLGPRVFNFTTHRLISDRVWDDVLSANPLNIGNSPTNGMMHGALRRLRRNLAREMFGVASPATIPNTLLVQTAFNSLRAALESSAPETWGHAGVTVAATRAQPIPFSDFGPNNGGIFNRIPSVRIAANRIGGFTQGIHVGASVGSEERSVHLVHVVGNSIALRVPLFAYERHGVFVGSASAALVRENVVEVIAPRRTQWLNSLPPTDGIRLWGEFGPQITVKDNLNYGVSTGVRLRNLSTPSPSAVQAVADNGYFFEPTAEGTAEDLA